MIPIEEEASVFIHNGDTAIGAVREVPNGGTLFRIYVENAGEFNVVRSAVTYAGEGKVVLNPNLLEPELQRAIGHAHDAEDPAIASKPGHAG